MDAAGNPYFTNLKDNGVWRRNVYGKITRLISDLSLHWDDAQYLAPSIPQPFLLVSIDHHANQVKTE